MAIGGVRAVSVQAPLVIICKECRSALLVSTNLSFAAAAQSASTLAALPVPVPQCDRFSLQLLAAAAAAEAEVAAATAAAAETAAASWLLGLAFILLYPVGRRWHGQQGI